MEYSIASVRAEAGFEMFHIPSADALAQNGRRVVGRDVEPDQREGRTKSLASVIEVNSPEAARAFTEWDDNAETCAACETVSDTDSFPAARLMP